MTDPHKTTSVVVSRIHSVNKSDTIGFFCCTAVSVGSFAHGVSSIRKYGVSIGKYGVIVRPNDQKNRTWQNCEARPVTIGPRSRWPTPWDGHKELGVAYEEGACCKTVLADLT